MARKCMGMLEHALAMVAIDMFRPLEMVEALCLERVALVGQPLMLEQKPEATFKFFNHTHVACFSSLFRL